MPLKVAGATVLAILSLPLLLGGCGLTVPMAISVAGGVMEIAKDGFDIRLDLNQMAIVRVAPQPAMPIVKLPGAP